jgi:NAD(P)-dependent dehydrogenase (short-subunit alcohol dehydrogenase family)
MTASKASLSYRGISGKAGSRGAFRRAVDTMVEQFAVALAPRGIRVDAVASGVIDTDVLNFVIAGDGQTRFSVCGRSSGLAILPLGSHHAAETAR